MTASLAWGYPNGAIPATALHPAPNFSPIFGYNASVSNLSNLMKAEAATQLSGMMQAFYRKFGKKLTLSEGYRSLAVQNIYRSNYLYHNGTLAAIPGTSIHGYALSADLAIDGGSRPTGEYLTWLRANARAYGFINDVATESWHWSYRETPTIKVKSYISNPNTTATTPAAAVAAHLEVDMPALVRNNAKGKLGYGATYAVSHGVISHLADDRTVDLFKSVAQITKVNEAGDLGTLEKVFAAFGIPKEAIDPVWIVKNSADGSHTWSRHDALLKKAAN